jgi:hemoglobin
MHRQCIFNIIRSDPMTTLYERLGGAPAMEAAVDIFYRKVLTDDRISRFFEDVDMERQAAKQKAFLTMVTGGPANYSGLDMRQGHAHLVAQGLNDDHFEAVVELLAGTLTELGANAADIAEVGALANSVRDDVLNREPVKA